MILSKKELKNAFQLVGLKQGDYVIAHTSLSKLGYVIGGPQTVIEALLETVGSEGTIMIPTQS